MFMPSKNYNKFLMLQQDRSDCGVACLGTIIQYYGGYCNLDALRQLSGTNTTGTTMLGLFQAANSIGFDVEGCKGDIDSLALCVNPVILHVIIQEKISHYVVCFGHKINKKNEVEFIIGDPSAGIRKMSKQEVLSIWQSKTFLKLIPNHQFVFAATIKYKKIKWMQQMLHEDYPIILMAIVLGIAVSILGITMSLFTQKLIDVILPTKNLLKLNIGIALVFILLIAKEVVSVIRQYFLMHQARGFSNRIIANFFLKILHLPKSFFDTRKIGDLTARLSDTARIQKVISHIIGSLIIDTLVVIVVLLALFSYSWVITIGAILILPIYFLVLFKANKKILTGQQKIMTSYAMSESNYISTLMGIEPIKLFNKQDDFTIISQGYYSKYQDALFSFGKFQLRLGLLVNCFGILFLVGILFYGSNLVLANQLKIGALMAILGLCSILFPSITNLALILIPINEAKVAFNRMFEFTNMETTSNINRMNITSFQKLSLEKIKFRYPGRAPLIHDVSIEVGIGEIIAIMGENGCGKSTLAQIISKNYAVESGTVIINNQCNIQDIMEEAWMKLIAVVPQQPHIFNGSIIENIVFEDAKLNPTGVEQFLHKYGLYDFINAFPQSFATIVGEEGINLSGGQKQMIAIARALYHEPKLLILDEATSAMDRNTEQFILKLLNELKSSMAIIFITHRLHILKNLCDRIYLMEQGTISRSGNHKALLTSANLYSNYWKDLMADTNNKAPQLRGFI